MGNIRGPKVWSNAGKDNAGWWEDSDRVGGARAEAVEMALLRVPVGLCECAALDLRRALSTDGD